MTSELCQIFPDSCVRILFYFILEYFHICSHTTRFLLSIFVSLIIFLFICCGCCCCCKTHPGNYVCNNFVVCQCVSVKLQQHSKQITQIRKILQSAWVLFSGYCNVPIFLVCWRLAGCLVGYTNSFSLSFSLLAFKLFGLLWKIQVELAYFFI